MTECATSRDEVVSALREEASTWKFLHDLFCPPSKPQWAWLNGADVREAWKRLAGAVDYSGTPEFPLPSDFAAFEQTYISTFDIGAPTPPCPLIESHWNRREPTPKVLQENLSFYKRFGLELRAPSAETPDHLLRQLGFLHFLAQFEANHCEERNEAYAGQAARARRDFLERHIRSWVPRAARKLRELDSPDWPCHWMNLLDASTRLAAGFPKETGS